jgi:hypothetical protein
MYNSIQHFVKYGIPQLEETQKTFMENPSLLGECAVQVKQIMLELGCQILSEIVEECNTMLEDSVKRKLHWQIKDRSEKHLLTSLGSISFTHTRFEHKTTGETAYLLDRILGLSPHARLSEDAKASLLEEAAQSSYEKASQLSGGEGRVSRETVMRHVHRIHAPSYKKEDSGVKRRVKYLYVEADEDHIALQFHKKKGDIKRWKGHGDNGQIVKLVYVHEGYEETERKRKQLKEVVYFGGLYSGKENEKLWREVKEYIEGRYDREAIERIYFQSDGGSWMKKGIEMLGGSYVVDEFHMKKYVKRMIRVTGEEGQEEEVLKYLERGERKKLKEWAEEKGKGLEEKKRKRLEESVGYLEKNWKGIRMRIKREEGVMGSSTESHISHVLSARMSSRPMGWSKEGAGKLSELRIYWKNGRKVEELLRAEKEEERKEEDRVYSAQDMIKWEKRSRKRNGKYVEALQATVSRQTGMKMYFQAAITGICG